MSKITAEALEEQVNTNLNFVDEQLDEAHSPDKEDIDGIVGYGMQLAAIISLAGKTLADAQQLLRMKELVLLKTYEHMWEKPTILKKLMEGTLAEYYQKVTWADRLCAACTHKMDFYRSVVSKYKQEIALQMMQINQKPS